MRVLVSGAGRGLGLGFVRAHLSRGDTVAAAYRTLTEDLRELSGQVLFVPLDQDDPASIQGAAQQVQERWGALDRLVNNAGAKHGPTWESSEHWGTLQAEGMLEVLRTNAVGPTLVTQAFASLLERGESPRVACVSSLYSSMGARPDWFADNFAYSMSKASVNMLMRTLAILWRDRVLTVSVDPGWVRTEMGGPQAHLSVEESVAGMIRVIDELTPDRSGDYIDWQGQTVPY